MKNIAILLMILGINYSVAGQDSLATGTVYFVRHTGFNGALINFNCFIDSSLVCDLRNNHYSEHTVNAGKHTLYVRTHSKELKVKNGLSLTVEPGKVYYVRILPTKAYSFGTALKMVEVSESIVKPIMDKCEPAKNCL